MPEPDSTWPVDVTILMTELEHLIQRANTMSVKHFSETAVYAEVA